MLLRLSSTSPFAFTAGRRVKITSNDVYVIELSDFPELAQKHVRNSSPLRSRVAHVNRGVHVYVPCLGVLLHIDQTERVLVSICPGSLLQFHAIRLGSIERNSVT